MPRPDPNISFSVRLAHALFIVLFILLAATGLRLTLITGQEWLSPPIRSLLDRVAPTGEVYVVHAFLGVLFTAAGIFYLAYMIFSGENRRLTNLFHRFEYPFLKKIAYFGALFLCAASIISGLSIYAGLFSGGPGYLFNSFIHQWSFRLLVLFTVLHTIEVLISRRSRINVIFLGKRFTGFLQWPPMLIAAAIATVGAVALEEFLDQPKLLFCNQQDAIVSIDGYDREAAWATADSVVVQTHSGANFTYSAAPVVVKAFSSRRQVYFLLRWPDDTRSLNRHLVKTDTGWIPETSAYIGPAGEDIFYEDQAAVYFGRTDGCLANCHVGSGERPGFHATDGDTADIWVWMAVSTNPTGEADDRFWAGQPDDSSDGSFFDNKAAGGYKHNLDSILLYPYFVPTHRIFKDWLLYGAPGYAPYHDQADTYSVGSRIPAVLVAPTTGDRGDIDARGVWRDGVWTVEMTRPLSTGSPADLRLQGEFHFGVAVFDNAEKKHTYHLRPIRIVFP